MSYSGKVMAQPLHEKMIADIANIKREYDTVERDGVPFPYENSYSTIFCKFFFK